MILSRETLYLLLVDNVSVDQYCFESLLHRSDQTMEKSYGLGCKCYYLNWKSDQSRILLSLLDNRFWKDDQSGKPLCFL